MLSQTQLFAAATRSRRFAAPSPPRGRKGIPSRLRRWNDGCGSMKHVSGDPTITSLEMDTEGAGRGARQRRAPTGLAL